MDKDEILKNFEEAQAFYDPLYDDCEQDWKFLHGENQWDERARSVREKDGLPCLTLNQLYPYAMQVVNDIRQARLAMRFSPVDDSGDIDTADVFQGIARNIERQSNAQMAYTGAALSAVGAGIGWIKVKTDYADIDTFDQEAFIERVIDFQSVYLDPASTALDGSDAEYGFILDSYTKERFEELYPDAVASNFADLSGNHEDDVVIAECYYKYYEKDTLYQIRLVDGSTRTIYSEQKDVLDEDGTVQYEILNERKIEIPYVKKCIYAGGDDPLEEEEFPCKHIPLVPVIGAEVFLDGKRQFRSLIHHGKDGQRMYNYHKSASTQLMALQPKTPVVGPKGSFQSYPNKWANANTQNFAFLEYDVVYDKNGQRVEPPSRQPPVQGSPALIQEAIGAREDIRLAIGMPQSNMGEVAGEVSGIAIRNRQIEGDNATFHFVDNLATSIAHIGRILVDMIPRLYSERKILRIIGDDGQERVIPVNQPYVKQDGQERPAKPGEEISGIYDLSVGKYDVVCDVGASYSSKRQETADKLIELVRAKPELADITGDLLFKALDLPMGEEIAERIRATMDPALLGDDPQANKLKQAAQALEAMQEKVLNYEAALSDKQKNAQFEQTVELEKLEQERTKLKIEAEKTAADIQKTMAEIEKMRAETSGFNMDAMQALGNAVSGLSEQVQDMGQAVEIILDAEDAAQSDQASSEPEQLEEPQD